MLDHHGQAVETPLKMAFRWRADDGPVIGLIQDVHSTEIRAQI